jgi:IclR family acetate operon transcriptional repressor
MSAERENAAYPSRAVDRVCDILDVLADSSDGLSMTEVSDATGLPRSSTFRYLAALEARHYVERGETQSAYRLGPAFRPRDDDEVARLTAASRPHLEELRDRLGETVNLGVLDGLYVVHKLVFESPNMMRLAARVGERGFVHSTALGKVLTSTIPQERVHAILRAAGMPSFTAQTIVDEAAFDAELVRVAEQGYGVDEAENQLDGRCVAVAIPEISLRAGISVSAPASRLAPADVPEVAHLLQRAAEDISRKMHPAASTL